MVWAVATLSDPVVMHLTIEGGHAALGLVHVLLEPLENDVLVVQLPLDQPGLLLDPQHAGVQLICVIVLLLLLLQEALVAVSHRGRALHGTVREAGRVRGAIREEPTPSRARQDGGARCDANAAVPLVGFLPPFPQAEREIR